MDYDDKLILALNNPITQNRMVVIEILGKRKTKKAVSKLCKMLFDKRDTYELIEIVKALQNIGTDEALECLKERKKIQKENSKRKFKKKIQD
ncbi:MAG: HEAT repeat domain-containing protein, partial [Sulfurihydrogenibium sp.]|nr:HEAT repeat domain-containing protein [Sulfurihydrogenibium sp.]